MTVSCQYAFLKHHLKFTTEHYTCYPLFVQWNSVDKIFGHILQLPELLKQVKFVVDTQIVEVQ